MKRPTLASLALGEVAAEGSEVLEGAVDLEGGGGVLGLGSVDVAAGGLQVAVALVVVLVGAVVEGGRERGLEARGQGLALEAGKAVVEEERVVEDGARVGGLQEGERERCSELAWSSERNLQESDRKT